MCRKTAVIVKKIHNTRLRSGQPVIQRRRQSKITPSKQPLCSRKEPAFSSAVQRRLIIHSSCTRCRTRSRKCFALRFRVRNTGGRIWRAFKCCGIQNLRPRRILRCAGIRDIKKAVQCAGRTDRFRPDAPVIPTICQTAAIYSSGRQIGRASCRERV